MKESKKGSIYKITSPSGKIYIGKSLNVKRRIQRYKYLECKNQRLIYHSIKKHGWDSHKIEIIAEVDSCFIDYWEKFYIRKYKSFVRHYNNGLNLTEGGEGSIGYKHTKESKNKMSVSKKGKLKPRPPVYQFSIDGYLIKKWESINEAQKSFNISGRGISRSLAGKGKTCYGYIWSLRDFVEPYDPKKERVKGILRAVQKIDSEGRIIQSYNSICEAALGDKTMQKNIQAVCSGRRNKCAGFSWRYI